MGVLLGCFPLQAQEDGILEDEFFLLQEDLSADEVVSASRLRQPIFWSPSAITVFTREDILASGARDLVDLLRRVPGFDVYRLKPSWSLVGARALSAGAGNKVLLLIDGREAMSETFQLPWWNAVSSDLEQVERVEVIRGPGSALYGANAYSAVISVTTRTGTANSVQLLVAGGEYGDVRLLARYDGELRFANQRLSWKMAVSTKQELNASNRRSAALDQIRPVASLRYQPTPSIDLSLASGAMVGDNTIYQFTGDISMSNVFNPWLNGEAVWQINDSTKLKGQVYYNGYSADMIYETDISSYGLWLAEIPDMTLDSHTMDGQIQLESQLHADFHLVAGGNLRYSTFSGTGLLLSGSDEVRGAAYGQLQWTPWRDGPEPRIQFTGGIRLDLNSITKGAFSPRIAAVAQPWRNHYLRLSYGLAFRKPSFFETRFHMDIDNFNPSTPEIVEFLARQLGNENLVNEKVHSFEAGWRARLLDDRLRVSVDLYYNLYRDTIILYEQLEMRMGLPDLANSIIRYENQGDEFDALGGEIDLALRLSDRWTLWGNLGMREVTYQDTGERSPYEPRLRFNLGGRFRPPSGFFFDLAVHYVSAYQMVLRDPESPISGVGLVDLGDNFLAIGRIGYRVASTAGQMLETGITIQTPLGLPYRDVPGVPTETDDFGGEVVYRLVAVYLRGSL